MMLRIQTVLIILLTAWMLTACGMVRRSVYPPVSPRTDSAPVASSEPETTRPETTQSKTTPREVPKPPAMIVADKGFTSLNEVQVKLMRAYREWKGTPYLLGGNTKNGIDCSQLVNVVFDEYLGISLPNTTRTQINAGEGIRRSAIRTGDLIFFRTGRKTLHVGIAVNHGEFLHASSSEGVMISKLGNSYWRDRFLAARRVL